MATNYALCSNKKCHMKAQCLRHFLFKSDLTASTDEVQEFWPNEDGECQHFLSFLFDEENELDNTAEGNE
jgi:hypothetical protein